MEHRRNGTCKRILFVDDDQDLCTVFGYMAKRLGNVACQTVTSAPAAKSLLTDGPPFDLIVLDVNLGSGLPGGVELFHWWRENSLPGTVIFLTGHAKGTPELNALSTKHGIVVLEKPVCARRLLRLMGSKP